jgi:hypothetical protein
VKIKIHKDFSFFKYVSRCSDFRFSRFQEFLGIKVSSFQGIQILMFQGFKNLRFGFSWRFQGY